MISALLALGCWLLYRRMWRAEPRRLRTAALLPALPPSVLVLGSGLVNGSVSPLLASRLDRGGKAWLAQRAAPPMILSGGQGPDEPRPRTCW